MWPTLPPPFTYGLRSWIGILYIGVTLEPERQDFHGARRPSDYPPEPRPGGLQAAATGTGVKGPGQPQPPDRNAQLTWCWHRTPWGTSAKGFVCLWRMALLPELGHWISPRVAL